MGSVGLPVLTIHNREKSIGVASQRRGTSDAGTVLGVGVRRDAIRGKGVFRLRSAL
jgi:hypothetical protein